MSRSYRFRIVNVFAESKLSGNPLAVVEDAQGLSEAEMQQLALQFNLSESTFIFALGTGREESGAAVPGRATPVSPSEADARVRIFTPTFEMPFAGHPTLGTAHVLRALKYGGDAVRLYLNVGAIPVTAQGDVWTLTANVPTHRAYEYSRAQIAQALGLQEDDIAGDPLWMNVGVEQLIVPLVSADAVRRTDPQPGAFVDYCSNEREAHAYVYAQDGASRVFSRYFWRQHGAILEDPGTGSACANLGGYLLASGASTPFAFDVHQGVATGRPCLLHLNVDAERRIHVGGRVIELMHGELQLD
ncbi:MAG: PhzF family phenazine biosynthesis protein [Rudaea sp.]|uniref:PhzF family phenazine biosynthesis protein n=1 Tax=unclassified Rudaea TaxID=2627037 RepID=UPI0010F58937|nr:MULTISPECIES: PhzF family phenazine biosynthesis protein [unclassified Rudaea]MBN8884706.1 PhzF family phenazine biosynthesis protein [Rudaea sp.]MBR0343937.1 PhzF family phenazine biosynthesis protein [Rudaea sp.]